MKKILLHMAGWVGVLLLLLPPPARSQTPPIIHKILIQHVGPPAVSDAFIRANIRSKAGERLYRATIEDDEAGLFATGFFFTIRVNETTTPDGVDVTYVVQGKPIVTDIRIVGNKKFSLKKLQKKLTSKIGQPLDELKLFHDAQAMQDLYQKAGYRDTTVKVESPSIDEQAGRAGVTITITESPKVRITDVIFDGAHAFTQKKLRSVLKTRRHWMFSWLTQSGVLKKDEFDEDKGRLVEFYQNAGYIDFTIVGEPKFEYASPTRMVIRFIVSEGRQYKVGSLAITGNKIFSTNDFIKGVTIDKQLMKLKMTPGKTFTPGAFDDDLDTLRDMYGSKGYLTLNEAGTTVIIPSRAANTATGTMDVAFDIHEGEKCYVEKIEIKGNEKTKDHVIRRELAIYPGEVYDMVRVKISKEKLQGMDYFSKVDTQAEETDVPTRKNLVINLEEQSMSSASVGAGFSSVESIVGFVEVKMKNFDLFNPPTFTGAGQKLQLIASIGSLYQDYEVSFVEPWLFDKQLALGVDLFHRQVDYDSLNNMYEETYDGGSVSLNRRLSQYFSGSAGYTLENAHVSINPGFTTNATTNYVGSGNGLYQKREVTPPNISTNIYDERGSDLINKFTLSLAYDTRRTVKDNDRGERTELSAQFATPPGNTEFYKLELKSSWFFPGFRPGHIFELDARGGVADGYGNNGHVPIFERWFLGGLYSLRGYRYRQIGPQDQFGEPLGGDTYFFGGAEYSIPIVKMVRLAWFYDMGNVFADPFSFRLTQGQQRIFSDNVGMGLRIVLPVGGGMPLRIDYGVPVTHDPNTGGSGRVQIGVGYTREF